MKNVSKEMSQALDGRTLSTTKSKCLNLLVISALAALLCPALASAVPILGPDLASFAVLGATGVTNVPTSTIGGNLGSAANPSHRRRVRFYIRIAAAKYHTRAECTATA